MHLKKITLSGFKTFVEPTQVVMAEGMNGIVGPNGCGKSNVVDAIRWVVGESSAKQLRSQSMSDVIFNGASGRKPLGKASVELLFDHQDKRLLGEYAAFSEIAIRREVTRDGDSTYRINGSLCRRKDIVELLLGTGLGPRSYAIIEQGMIARFIEAKPEQLRASFEEVAGIAKYNVKRRETHNRMRHTEENLERVADVCLELDKQLRSLKRQANAASQYKGLKEEERTTQGRLYARHIEAHAARLTALRAELLQEETALSAHDAKRTTLETESEAKRQAYETSFEAHAAVQKSYYEHDAALVRLEQSIQSVQANQQRWQEEALEQSRLLEQVEVQQKEDEAEHARLRDALEAYQPERVRLKAVCEAKRASADSLKTERAHCREDGEQLQDDLAQAQRAYDVMQAKQEQLRDQLQRQEQARARWSKACAQLEGPVQSAVQTSYQEALQQAESEADEADQACAKQQADLTALRERVHAAKKRVPPLRQALASVKSEWDALQALQAQALRHQGDAFDTWLSKHDLQASPCLADQLKVDADWAWAVEMVLGARFQTRVVDDVAAWRSADLPEGCALLSPPAFGAVSGETPSLSSLASKLGAPWSDLPALRGIEVAEDWAAAETRLKHCQPHESVILKNGVWMGPGWVRTPQSHAEEDSVLLRQQRLIALKEAVHTHETQLEEAEQQAHQDETALDAAQTAWQHAQQTASQAHQTLSKAQASLKAWVSEQAAQQRQREQASAALLEAEEAKHDLNMRLEAQAQDLTQLHEALSEAQAARASWCKRKDDVEARLDDAYAARQEAQHTLDRHEAQHQAQASQCAMLAQHQKQRHDESERMRARVASLQAQYDASQAPLAEEQAQLNAHLEARKVLSDQLSGARDALEGVREAVTQLEKHYKEAEKHAALASEAVAAVRLKIESESVRQATVLEQLEAMPMTLEAAEAGLTEDLTLSVLEDHIVRVQKRLARLGPINLAAIEEYDEVSARRTHLRTQHEDLQEAMRLLQGAIDKIDRETKTQFKHTFDQVNANFKALFPKVFGGGEASLALTEADWLTAGVVVRAQPPGKRNATIHMLSGGEKALTAIALVFALFRLSPAPFCVLDEVDAPLDDANVGRFCRLVASMANEVQFIVISHNKVTIEASKRLLGVTMSEPGVSRVVSVNMEEAVAMVDD